MVVTAADNFFQHTGCCLGGAGVVVVYISADNIRSGACVGGRELCLVREDMQRPGIVDHGVAARARMAANGFNCVHNGLQRDVVVGVITSQPTDEVADIEM